MARNLIDTSKKYIEYYYKDGKAIKNPTHKFNGRVVGDAETRFMSNYFVFLMESQFLNCQTKMWLESNASSVRVMVETHNEQIEHEEKKLLASSVSSAIGYDKRKLQKHFPINMIENVLAYPEEYLEMYDSILNKLRRKYMKFDEYEKSLTIALPKEAMERSITDTEWMNLQSLVKTYSKREVEKIKKGEHDRYNLRVTGYFNYIISSDNISDLDKARLKRLKEILGID